MVEQNFVERQSRSSVEQASRHLLETLQIYDPSELRASVNSIIWDAREYADWLSADGVAQRFSCKDLADASFRYGTATFEERLEPQKIISYLNTAHFQKMQRTVCDRITEPDVRSLVFFSQGVKYAAAVHRIRRLQQRASN